MPDNVGDMFYVGEMPWHGKGLELARPATVEHALRAGGLDWQVAEASLMTAEDPPSPVTRRKALVRADRPSGSEGRVLGVVYNGYRPLQNRDAALLFDTLLGGGKERYVTGGYLGDGQRIWLLADLGMRADIGAGDAVASYALMANGHDGLMAFHLRLTAIRVVCQNTLGMALNEKQFGRQFSRAHVGTTRDHAEAAGRFLEHATGAWSQLTENFRALSRTECSDDMAEKVLVLMLPDPKPPRDAKKNPGLTKAYEAQLRKARAAREAILKLRASGKGHQLAGVRNTFWGLLNAVTEYIDHHAPGERNAGALLIGGPMDFKQRAFRIIQKESEQAA